MTAPIRLQVYAIEQEQLGAPTLYLTHPVPDAIGAAWRHHSVAVPIEVWWEAGGWAVDAYIVGFTSGRTVTIRPAGVPRPLPPRLTP